MRVRIKSSKIIGIIISVMIILASISISSIETRAEGMWMESSDGWWYQQEDGSYPWETWKEIDGNWYYFDWYGYMTTGWKNIKGYWYFFFPDGHMASDMWIDNYWVDKNGAMTDTWGTTGWQMRGGVWKYYDENGNEVSGWVKSGRYWYYVDNGNMHTGWLQDGGSWYYFDSEGRMQTDWVWDGYGWYLMDGNGKWINDSQIIYLTFDDGPGPYTDRLLGILERYNVKATFFVTSAFPGYAGCIKKEYDAGHTVAVHSYTHNYRQIYASESAYWSDFENMESVIVGQTGERTNLFRFPGGSSNAVSKFNSGIMTRLAAQSGEKGYKYFDWNVSSGDAGETTSSVKVTQNIINGIKGHNESVVLCHDVKSYTVDAMETFIPWALSHGYTFIPLSENSIGAHHPIQN